MFFSEDDMKQHKEMMNDAMTQYARHLEEIELLKEGLKHLPADEQAEHYREALRRMAREK